MKNNINFAAKGSLSSSAGMDNYLAGTAEYKNSEQAVKMISDFDDKVAAIHSRHTGSYDDLTQQYFCPLNMAGNDYFFAIRTHKNFTQFPNKHRNYDRREYFYFDFSNEINHIDFAASLPEMRQYESKDFNVILPEVKKGNYSLDSKLVKGVFASLLTGNSVTIKVNSSDFQKTESAILSALSALPQQYAKYIGFGFNVKDDDFSNSNLHIFTTLDDIGVSLESLKNLAKNEKLVNHLLYANYSDAEVTAQPISKQTLYDLLNYHKLHFAVDNNDKSVFEQSKVYFEKFASAADKYIKERLQAIYNFWVRNKLLDYELIQLIDVNTAISRDKNYENSIITAYQPKEKENVKEYLVKYGKILDNGIIEKLVGELGLDYFYKGTKIVELQKNIEAYIQKIVAKHTEQNYLQQAFSVAEKYDFKVTLQPTSNIDTYKLFDSKKNYINNFEDIMKTSEKQTIETIPSDIDNLLDFAGKEKDVVTTPLFISRLTEIYKKSEDKYLIFTKLLNDIAKNKENRFLNNKDNNLFCEIKQLELGDKKQKKELLQLIRKISKIESLSTTENDAVPLIRDVITQYETTVEKRKENAKQKKQTLLNNPTVSKEIKLWKTWAVVATAFFIISTVFAIFPYLNKPQTPQTGQIDTTKHIQIDTIVFVSKLNPLPNDTLKNSKGNVKIATKNDSIGKVVDGIFTKNKNDVEQYYKFQKEDYIKYIIEANKDSCFRNQTDTCQCDTLRILPSYKLK